MAYIAANLSLIGQTIGGTVRRYEYPTLDNRLVVSADGYFADPRLQGGDRIYVTVANAVEPPRIVQDEFTLVVISV